MLRDILCAEIPLLLRAELYAGSVLTAAVYLGTLGVDPDVTPVVTRDQVRHAKPYPDLFLAAADRLGARIEHALVIGDSVWDTPPPAVARSAARATSFCSA